jgi:hypothetical protein
LAQTSSGASSVDQHSRELKEAARKLFALCAPWPEWKIFGSFIAESSTDTVGLDQELPVGITKNDAVGDRVLSYIPESMHRVFLSLSGQRIVSSSFASL